MNTKVNATIVKETEKAYQLTIEYWTSDTAPIKNTTMWVPKSCCTVVNGQVTEIADWILNKWITDRVDYMRQRGYSNRNSRISFDMDEYVYINKAKQAKSDAFKAELAETIEVTAAYVKPFADQYMSELAWDAQFIYDTYKDSNILPAEIMDALKGIAAEITKAFGIRTEEGEWWDNFAKERTTFEAVRDFLWMEIGERCGVYGVDLHRYEVRHSIKLNNGLPVSESTLDQIICNAAHPDKTLLAKKFKKNWDFYNKFYSIVNSMFNI